MFDVVHVAASVDPRHGGPSRTVPALAAAQAALGARVALACLEPVPDELRARHPGLDIRAFPPDAGPAGTTLCFSRALAAFLGQIETRAVHAHGLWLRPLHHAARAAGRLRAPLIVAPRGMLEPWAVRHHAWKKRLAAALLHPRALSGLASWHATSDQEARHLRESPAWLRAPANTPVCVAPNGVEAPEPGSHAGARAAWLAAFPHLAGTRVALFYGRLHRKKRVAELVRLWSSRARPGWTLLVAGIPDGHSTDELAALATNPAAPVVVADGAGSPPPYALAELFLLPSHSENFGQAVAEALAAGLPALVTDTLPWAGIERADAGSCVGWENYGPALDSLLDAPAGRLAAMGERGRAWALADFSWASSARRLLDAYLNPRAA